MTYELFYYRLASGRDLQQTHDLDLSMRDSDEAEHEPHRQLNIRDLANKILGLNLGFKMREDHDVFSIEANQEHDHESLELTIEDGDGQGISATLWACHVRLALPTGEPHPERDGAYEQAIRAITILCHDEGLNGYDPQHQRPVSPATLHEIAVDAAEGEHHANKPWWKVWG